MTVSDHITERSKQLKKLRDTFAASYDDAPVPWIPCCKLHAPSMKWNALIRRYVSLRCIQRSYSLTKIRNSLR